MPFPNRPRGWARTVVRILERDEYRCWICGKYGATSIDHVVPRSKGGGHEDANLRAAHVACNSSKGNRMTTPVVLPQARPSRWR